MTGNGARGFQTELMAGGVLLHIADDLRDDLHRIPAVGTEKAVAAVGLAGGTVDDGYEVSGYDDSVLAFLLGVFRYDALLLDFHRDSCFECFCSLWLDWYSSLE